MVLNFLIIGLVALIAYWWGNQGLFSAILHLLCTIVAGAIALGLWEPVTVKMFLSGGQFDQYAWGLTLVGLFVVSLVVLRLLSDKLIRANVNLPHSYNLVAALPVGAAAGVLTVGILLIGCGYVSSTVELVGYRGVARSTKSGKIEEGEKLWVPVHTWTVAFYSYLSATSLSTGLPMAEAYPQMDRVAGSLYRDGFKDGRSALSMPPAPVDVKGVMFCRDTAQWAVQVHFSGKALDFGERLTLSSSQVRLIGDATGTGEAPVEHPVSWTTPSGSYDFDNASYYITSTPGQQQADITIIFDAKAVKANAKFIQIKGTRFRLPRAAESCDFGTTGSGAVAVGDLDASSAREIDPGDMLINARIPVQLNKNQLPGGLRQQDGFLVEGSAEMDKTSSGGISSQLKVEGIAEPAGTRVVQLVVSRGSSADIFTRIRKEVPDNATIQLVDDKGNAYLPVGFVYEDGTRVTIDLRPGTYVRTYADLPSPPSAGDQKLRLIFRVTENSTIVALKVGDKIAGECNILVPAKKSK